MNSLSYIFVIGLLFVYSLVNAKPYQKRSNGKGMHVEGSKLLDGNNQPFVFRGVNIAHAWYADKTQYSINEVASLGANSARIVLACGAKYPKTSSQEVSNIIRWCENAGLICVLELHDFTGSDNTSDITNTAVNYWREIKDLVNAHKDYIIVNIANEWETGYKLKSSYGNTYVEAVKSMRNIGIQNAIMIDASGWGQEVKEIVKDAKRILSADPDNNVIFSYHVYGVLGINSLVMKTGFELLKRTGVCWIVGEFGWRQSGVNVAYKELMEYCDKNEIGWIAWSWAGNSGGDEHLDLTSVNTFSRNDLTQWGNDVFFGEYGISKTSRFAYNHKINPAPSPAPAPRPSPSPSPSSSGENYCNSCNVTATGSDGSLWGWENNKSCKIDTNKCGSGNNNNNNNKDKNNKSDRAPNGYPYCSTCNVTATGSDGSLWGWENNQSCVINNSKC